MNDNRDLLLVGCSTDNRSPPLNIERYDMGQMKIQCRFSPRWWGVAALTYLGYFGLQCFTEEGSGDV